MYDPSRSEGDQYQGGFNPPKDSRRSKPYLITACILIVTVTLVAVLWHYFQSKSVSLSSRTGSDAVVKADQNTTEDATRTDSGTTEPSPSGEESQLSPVHHAPAGVPAYAPDANLEASADFATVSPDHCRVTVGALEVDFHTWNLQGEDKLLVQQFEDTPGVKAGETIRGYDFSLASGQSEFISPVSIRIPCTVKENEEGSVRLYNPVQAEWEFVGYELSEDRQSYLVEMPHFSTLGEIKTEHYVGTENNIDSTDGAMTTNGSLYQYLSAWGLDGSTIPLAERDVYMSDASFRNLFSSIKKDELIKLVKMGNLPSNDAVAFALGTLNDAQSLADSSILMTHLDAALSANAKIRLGGVMAGFGGLLTVGRIAYQANKGGSFSAVLLENKYNILESLLGTLAFGAGYIGAAAAASAFSVAAVVVFSWSLAMNLYDGITQYECPEEAAYWFFMEKGQVKFSKASMRISRSGDFALGTHSENIAPALRQIYDAYGDKPKELDAAISDFYHDYAYLFWTAMTKEERSDFYYKEYLGSPLLRTDWNEPTPEQISRWAKKAEARVVSESKPILLSFARTALVKMQDELYRTVKREIEPYLNEKLTFIVHDANLEEGQTFDESPYASFKLAFGDRSEPLYVPKYVSLGAYSEEVFTPKPTEDSDLVYTCTMYHYIQMGCPTEMTFFGDPKANLPKVTVPFEVDGNEVVLELKGSPEPVFGEFMNKFKNQSLEEEPKDSPYFLLSMQPPVVAEDPQGTAVISYSATPYTFESVDPLLGCTKTYSLKKFAFHADLYLTDDGQNHLAYEGTGQYEYFYNVSWTIGVDTFVEEHKAGGELRIFPTFEMQGDLPEVEFFFSSTEQVSLNAVISGKSHHEQYEGGNMSLVASCHPNGYD